jgi:hypothetical protein
MMLSSSSCYKYMMRTEPEFLNTSAEKIALGKADFSNGIHKLPTFFISSCSSLLPGDLFSAT